MQAAIQEKHYWECPECHSRFFSEPLTFGVRDGVLVKIHPICPKCFEKCRAGHDFGYGELCNVCGDPRCRFNLIRHSLAPNDPDLGQTSTGSTSYPTSTDTCGSTGNHGTADHSYVVAGKVTISAAGTAKSLGINFYGSESGNITLGLYSHNSGSDKPASLLASTPSTGMNTSAGWQDPDVSARCYAAAGTYWIAETISADKQYYYDSGGRRSYYARAYGLDSTWSASSTEQNAYCPNLRVSYVKIKNYLRGYKFQYTDTTGGQVQAFNFFVSLDASGHFKLALYDDDGGSPSKPHNKLWDCAEVTATANAWNNVNESSGTRYNSWDGTLAHNAWYWLLYQWDDVSSGPSYTTGTSNYGILLQQDYGTFPSTWGGGTNVADEWSEYLTYTGVELVSASDSGIGVDTPSVLDVDFVTPTDSGVGSDMITVLDLESISVTDSGLAAEFAWHTKGLVLIGSFEPPHVVSIRIVDQAVMATRQIQGGTLPKQKMQGKPGRVVEIEGWTKNQSDIDNMDALTKGVPRTFIHPSGDSFAVLVTDFNPEARVDEYDRRIYRLTLKETREW